MLGAAVERTPKIEQVNLNGGRLIREAKVCSVLCAICEHKVRVTQSPLDIYIHLN